MTREEKLEQALTDLLSIIDGNEFRGASIMASIHGYRVSPSVAKANEQIIKNAYNLINKDRPKV